MVVVADLVARMRGEGIQETVAQVKLVGEAAQVSARALEIMAQAASKANPNQGSAAQILEVFQRANVQPTAAALAQARGEMEKIATAAAQAVQPTQAAARAARDHADAAATGARAAQNVAAGWRLSESSLIRFGAGLAGISLGISLIGGAAQIVHDAIGGIVDRQLDWERSVRTLSGLYGQTGAQAAAFATAQANLPGVLGTQQEFAQAAINASGLRLRYGIEQQTIDQLTTTGGRIAFATGMTDPAARAQLQAQILAAVTTGANLPPQYGIYTDPEAVARRLGGAGAASLQAFTPQELMQARAAIVTEGGAGFVDRAQANQRAALDTATAAAKAADTAASNLTNYLENTGSRTDLDLSPTADLAYQQAVGNAQLQQRRAALGLPDLPVSQVPSEAVGGNIQGLAAIDAERGVVSANERLAKAFADSATAQQRARETIERLSNSVDAAASRVISFAGSLEDSLSIAHGDLIAQGQAALTSRSRSSVPTAGMGVAEIGAIARGTTSAQIWQNYVAELAQTEATDAVRRNLQQLASVEGPGLEGQRGAAQRALASAPAIDVVNRNLGAAQTRAAQIDLQAAEQQSRIEAITLVQRERGLQLMRSTVDLRKLDVQQQQVGLDATQAVIRAQQAALPIQRTLGAAQFQQDMAMALSQRRMALLLQGKDVSGLPSVNELIKMNVAGQFASAEAAPEAVQRAYDITRAQQPATAAQLAEALTASQIRSEELKVDLQNLSELPQLVAYQLDLTQTNHLQLDTQRELVEYTKQLVWIMSNQFGSSNLSPPSPSDLPGNRRGGGPY